MRAVLRSGLIMATMVFCAFVVGCGGSSTDGTSASNVIELIVAPDSLNLAEYRCHGIVHSDGAEQARACIGGLRDMDVEQSHGGGRSGHGLDRPRDRTWARSRYDHRNVGRRIRTWPRRGASTHRDCGDGVTFERSHDRNRATRNVTAVATGPNGIVNNPTITWSSANPERGDCLWQRHLGHDHDARLRLYNDFRNGRSGRRHCRNHSESAATSRRIARGDAVDRDWHADGRSRLWSAHLHARLDSTASGGQGGRWGLTRWRMTFSTGEFVGADSGSTNPANPTGDTIQTGRSYTFNGVWVATWADNTGPVYRPFIVLLSISYIDQAAQVTRTTDPVQMSCS